MVSIFSQLRKEHGFRCIKSKHAIRSRQIENHGIFKRFTDYWKDSEHFSWPNQPWYTGTGLHYDPNCPVQPYSKQLCGNDGNRIDYENTLAYNHEVVPGLLDCFGPFPMVRCKITCIAGNNLGSILSSNQGWHRDERPHEVLRVIIPISSDNSYRFQLDNRQEMGMSIGHAYAFDQSIFHRVFSCYPSNLNRIHLILSFVTWFDNVDGTWRPNAFCGHVHPLDLFDEIRL